MFANMQISLEQSTRGMENLSAFGAPNLIRFSQLGLAIPYLALIKNSFAEQQFVESEHEDDHVEDCFLVAAPYYDRYLPLKLTSDTREDVAEPEYDSAEAFKTHFVTDALRVAQHFRATGWDARNVDGMSCILLLWKPKRNL